MAVSDHGDTPGQDRRFTRVRTAEVKRQAQTEEVLRQWQAGPVEHIGSTSVPGLRAKPVIDMLAQVRSLADAQAAVPVLTDAGWLFWPEVPCRYYRLLFLRPRPQSRTHHLHVI